MKRNSLRQRELSFASRAGVPYKRCTRVEFCIFASASDAVIPVKCASPGAQKSESLLPFLRAFGRDNTFISRAVFIAWYNLRRKHDALKANPTAMANKLTDHVWTIKELIEKPAELN